MNWAQVATILIPVLVSIIAFGVTAYGKLEVIGVQLSTQTDSIVDLRMAQQSHSNVPAHPGAAIKLNELTVLNQERWATVDRRLARIERAIRVGEPYGTQR